MSLELNKEYRVSCSDVIKGGAHNPAFVIKHGSSYINTQLSKNTVFKFKCTDTISNIYIYSNAWDAAGSSEVTSIIKNLMIRKAEYEDGNYVPYNTIQINKQNKNLFISDINRYRQPYDYRLCDIKLEQNKTYTLSAELVGESITGVVVALVPYGTRYSDFVDVLNAGTCIYTTGYTFTKTITVDSTWTAPKLVVFATSTAVFNSIFTNYNVQLEEGSSATTYVAHKEKRYNFPLSEGQYLASGDYLARDGIHKIRGKVTYDGTETWVVYSDKNTDSYYCYWTATPSDCIMTYNVDDIVKSNMLIEGTWDDIYAKRHDTQIIALRDNNRFYVIRF